MNGRAMAIAALCYLLITALLFHNLLPILTTHLFGDLGDPLLNTSILAWNAKHLPLTADWWNFPAFAPLSGVTAFTEHLLGAYSLTSPIIWITGNPVLAYNALHLLTLPLNAVAAFALVRELTGSWVGAFIGGLAFAFAPFTGEHVSHIQMLMAFGMPLALYGLHRYQRCVGRGADERCKIAIQTNNVEVDDRGYIYIVDRANTGMHILELSGAARRVANFPTNATN
jgi:hypothetical protein